MHYLLTHTYTQYHLYTHDNCLQAIERERIKEEQRTIVTIFKIQYCDLNYSQLSQIT